MSNEIAVPEGMMLIPKGGRPRKDLSVSEVQIYMERDYMSIQELTEKYNVSESTIYRILRRFKSNEGQS